MPGLPTDGRKRGCTVSSSAPWRRGANQQMQNFPGHRASSPASSSSVAGPSTIKMAQYYRGFSVEELLYTIADSPRHLHRQTVPVLRCPTSQTSGGVSTQPWGPVENLAHIPELPGLFISSQVPSASAPASVAPIFAPDAASAPPPSVGSLFVRHQEDGLKKVQPQPLASEEAITQADLSSVGCQGLGEGLPFDMPKGGNLGGTQEQWPIWKTATSTLTTSTL
ncbi:hypothetical protein DHEL01_v210528 [Diaporthe helianthi]|uniref:Uncharacterized protein n=1 Tax=Diaporthe helianthi TaxID=158607 RepID=A0A2P5HLF9_DIAHE|nr:hypothetical protein DHEL01_v210528 [Diaporthe helianthi]